MRMNAGKSARSSLVGAAHAARGILAGDLLWTTLAFFAAGFLRYGTQWDVTGHAVTHAFLPLLAASWILWSVLFYRMKLDGFHGGWCLSSVVSGLMLGVCAQMSLLLAVAYLTRQYVSRLALAYYGILLFPGFLLVRYLVRRFLNRRHAAGSVCRVVIAGSGHIAGELATKISNHPEMLCRVVGLLFPKDRVDDHILIGNNRQQWSDVSTLEVTDLLDSNQVDELIIALPHPSTAELVHLATKCQQRGMGVSVVPQPYELYVSRPRLHDLDGLPILQLCKPGIHPSFTHMKRVFDVSVALLLLLPAVVVVAPCALLLRVRKGRAFQWDVRCGKDFQEFGMLRLNVSRRNLYKSSLERWLDRLSITELPQLWNVLRGEMSLVGPRPESPTRARRYTVWQQRRLSVRPGMTGLAQVRGLREAHSSEAKARLDLQYLLNLSLFADISILLQTIWTLATRSRDMSAVQEHIFKRDYPSIRNSEFQQETPESAHCAQPSAD
jgi:lipopolysaccharide/colanic/teichoic acid biosynthesis glycosyltransferase